MKVIKDYIEVLFLQVPVTPETLQVKEDLLNTAEDHFEGLVTEGVSEKEAIGIVISEFGSIDDILTELELNKVKPEVAFDSADEQTTLTIDEIETYWAETRTLNVSMGIGLAMIAFGFACLPLLPYGNGGVVTFLIFMFILFLWGIGFLISFIHFLQYRKKTQQLADVSVSAEIRAHAEQKMEEYRKSYLFGMSAGFLSFLFALPTIFFFFHLFYSSMLGIFFFFILCGIGMFLILYVSLIQKEFKRIVNMSTNVKKKRQRLKKTRNRTAASFHEDIFWVSVVIVYFVFSFMFRAWLYSWLIFLVGYVVGELLKNRIHHKQSIENEGV